MRNMYGGKWISMLGIPPATILFIPLMLGTMVANRLKRNKRARKLANNENVNKAFIGSWF
jgi:hypothetical protein